MIANGAPEARDPLPVTGSKWAVIDSSVFHAVQQTLAHYAFALDQQDMNALKAVLTEQAVWEFRIAGTDQIGPILGSTAILEFARRSMPADTRQLRHNLTNIIIDTTGTGSARVQANLMLTSNAGGVAGLLATGAYTFSLDFDEGSWRIAKLFLNTDNAW